MAKLSALEALNEVLRNCGEPTVSVLTSLSGLQLVAWNKIIEAIQDICTDETARWSFLESLGRIEMATGTNAYAITSLTGSSTGTDCMAEDKESFKSADSGYGPKFLTPQEFDAKYPKGITTDMTGYPEKYTKYAGQFVFDKKASASQNGKFIDFRYWKYPTYYSTATTTSTCDIPEPFDRTCLVALATLKVMAFLGNEEAAVYKMQVYGDPQKDEEGSLNKMRRLNSSPILKPRMTYQF